MPKISIAVTVSYQNKRIELYKSVSKLTFLFCRQVLGYHRFDKFFGIVDYFAVNNAVAQRNIAMDTQTLTAFFMWCTIINASILVLWSGFSIFAPDWVYQSQRKWFPIPRETFDVVIYCFIGLFKVIFLVFNLAPYVALLIVT